MRLSPKTPEENKKRRIYQGKNQQKIRGEKKTKTLCPRDESRKQETRGTKMQYGMQQDLITSQMQTFYIGSRMSHVGRNVLEVSWRVPTTVGGRRLTRFAPDRTANMAVLDIPDRPELFDRMDPASDAVSALRKIFGGGAKSRAVNVPDLRRACLRRLLVWVEQKDSRCNQLTGLGGRAAP